MNESAENVRPEEMGQTRSNEASQQTESDAELKKYAEGLQFGTPKFLAFADATEIIGRRADINDFAAMDGRTKELAQQNVSTHEKEKEEAKRNLALATETKRINENTVPGYAASSKEFFDLYNGLYDSEKNKIKQNLGKDVVPDSEVWQDARKTTESEADVKAQKELAAKFAGIRQDVLKKSIQP